jgi:hypothetical protein
VTLRNSGGDRGSAVAEAQVDLELEGGTGDLRTVGLAAFRMNHCSASGLPPETTVQIPRLTSTRVTAMRLARAESTKLLTRTSVSAAVNMRPIGLAATGSGLTAAGFLLTFRRGEVGLLIANGVFSKSFWSERVENSVGGHREKQQSFVPGAPSTCSNEVNACSICIRMGGSTSVKSKEAKRKWRTQ